MNDKELERQFKLLNKKIDYITDNIITSLNNISDKIEKQKKQNQQGTLLVNPANPPYSEVESIKIKGQE